MSKPSKQGKRGRTDETVAAQSRRDEAWDDRLRRVGNACFVDVAWSTRDKPSWPLPPDAAIASA
jgi:hypothetical protein